MIQFESVSKIYSETSRALEDVTLAIEPKEFVSIVGESGAGKSTLLKLLIAEERPTKGSVYFDTHNVHRLGARELAHVRRRIGTVFQDIKLIEHKTAFENVAFVLEAAGAADGDIGPNVLQALDIVGLKHKADFFPRQLSGGERQRVAIARAIINSPDVVLADEPTGNLDPINTKEIVDLLLRVNELGLTVILATHSKQIVDDLGRRVITMHQGRVAKDQKDGGKYVIMNG